METKRYSLGLDVAKNTIEVCLLRGDEKSRTQIENNESGFKKLLAWLNGIPIEDIHACLEPTGRYSDGISCFLLEHDILVSQVNSFAVKNHGRSQRYRSKTDRIDAYLLADFCRKNNPPAWEKREDIDVELKEIHRRISNLDKAIRQEKNRLKAGIKSELVLSSIKESIVRLKLGRDLLEKEAKKLIKSSPRHSTSFKIIKSFVGLGDQSAIRLLAMIHYPSFSDGRKISCYSGLTPKRFESGTSIRGQEMISREGSTELRSCLYFPAIVARHYNPQLRAFADRLEAAGKPKKKVLCAVMRKMLVITAAMIRNGELYDSERAMPATFLAV